MDNTIDYAVDHTLNLCAPHMMSKEGAVEFLSEVVDRLKSSLEAIEEELANEQEEA